MTITATSVISLIRFVNTQGHCDLQYAQHKHILQEQSARLRLHTSGVEPLSLLLPRGKYDPV